MVLRGLGIFPWAVLSPCRVTFEKTTEVAYGQNISRSLKILVLCNTSRFYKRREIANTLVVGG